MSDEKMTVERVGMTPGPWEWVVHPGDRGRVKGKPLYRNLWNKAQRVAVLDADYSEFNGEGVWETWIRVSEANARAIAAVPELIALAQQAQQTGKELHDWLSSGEDFDHDTLAEFAAGLEMQARGALAQATGGGL